MNVNFVNLGTLYTFVYIHKCTYERKSDFCSLLFKRSSFHQHWDSVQRLCNIEEITFYLIFSDNNIVNRTNKSRKPNVAEQRIFFSDVKSYLKKMIKRPSSLGGKSFIVALIFYCSVICNYLVQHIWLEYYFLFKNPY